MGLLDNVRNLAGGTRRLGLELGRRVVAVEVKGRPLAVTAAGRAAHAGYSGEELGGWLKRWLETVGTSAKSTRAVVTEGTVYHYLVTMPAMSDGERHLAAGAEVRKHAPVPAAQLAYSHMAVGDVREGGLDKQRVLISAIDKTTLNNATDALAAAGLRAELVTTVPAALVQAAKLLPSTAGGLAIAWLSEGRSYLVVLHEGTVELVRDFQLRDIQPEVDPEGTAAAAAAELRRSFLYFGQRAHGAQVSRLVLAGPLANLADLSVRLSDQLEVRTEPFDVAGHLDTGFYIESAEQPAFAVALGAAALEGVAAANLVPPEAVTEVRVRRAMSWGTIAAAAVLALLVAWGLFALVSAGVQEGRLEQVQERLAAARGELQEAQQIEQERDAHRLRQALLEDRALESTLIGVWLQRIGQRIPDAVVLERIGWTRSSGPAGQTYWNAQIDGLVLTGSRSESQAVFNRMWTLMVNDPLVDDLHLVEPLVIGTQAARTPPERTAAIRESLGSGPRVVRPGAPGAPNAGRRGAGPAGAEYFEGPASTGGVGYLPGSDGAPGDVIVRTTLDDLPPFAPTATSVGFKVMIQLKGFESGGER